MTKSNGIKSLKQAAKLLNKHSPDGESLAYINPEEARTIKSSWRIWYHDTFWSAFLWESMNGYGIQFFGSWKAGIRETGSGI